MIPRAPSSLMICVQEQMVAPQYFECNDEMLSLRFSKRAWSPTLGEKVGRFHIFLPNFSTTESTSRMAEGKRAKRQWAWVIL